MFQPSRLRQWLSLASLVPLLSSDLTYNWRERKKQKNCYEVPWTNFPTKKNMPLSPTTISSKSLLANANQMQKDFASPNLPWLWFLSFHPKKISRYASPQFYWGTGDAAKVTNPWSLASTKEWGQKVTESNPTNPTPHFCWYLFQ